MPDQRAKTQTFYLIARLQLELRMLLERALQPYGVTPMLYRLMSLIRTHPESSSADLARLLETSPQSANELLGSLMRAEYINRQPDPNNRRILRIELNEAGVAVLSQCEQVVLLLEAECLDVLDPTSLEIFRRSLALVGKRIQQKRNTPAVVRAAS